jgi:hypothetical protein
MRRQNTSLAMGFLSTILIAVSTSAKDSPDSAAPALGAARVIRSRMIWDAAARNAFTDLIRWKDRWYCSFREGEEHASYDGTVRIVSSLDGEKWTCAAEFGEDESDLRDPKLCVLPDGRLLVGVGVRKQDEKDPKNWHTTSRIYITGDGEKWDSHTIGDPQVWMWRYVTRGEYVYSFGYRQRPKGLGGETFLRFYRSRDGETSRTAFSYSAGRRLRRHRH